MKIYITLEEYLVSSIFFRKRRRNHAQAAFLSNIYWLQGALDQFTI